MRVAILVFCLIGAVVANPISYNHVLSDSSELDANTTESLSASQSSENSTSELQSSEESVSNQSSKSESSESSESSKSSESSESSESTSEDKTSGESDSQSDEDQGTDFMVETRDNSMSSEENVRKSWVQIFGSVANDLSTEGNSSTEVSDEVTGGSPAPDPTGVTFKQAANATQGQTNLQVAGNSTGGGGSSSSSSSESSSSESHESSDASDSAELQQVKANDCVNGTQSCESEESSLHGIGDDAHFAVDNLFVPDDDERELSLRR